MRYTIQEYANKYGSDQSIETSNLKKFKKSAKLISATAVFILFALAAMYGYSLKSDTYWCKHNWYFQPERHCK